MRQSTQWALRRQCFYKTMPLGAQKFPHASAVPKTVDLVRLSRYRRLDATLLLQLKCFAGELEQQQ